jgi:hypothetical protein
VKAMGNAGFEKEPLPTASDITNQEPRKLRNLPHYQRLAERCGFPLTLDESLQYHADSLDRLCFCATRFPSRAEADDMTRLFCKDWRLSTTSSVINLLYTFFNHAYAMTKTDIARTPESQLDQLNRGWSHVQKLQMGCNENESAPLQDFK